MRVNLNRYVGVPALILLVLSIPVLIVCSTVCIYSKSVSLYKAGFEKYNISRVTGISNVQLEQIARQLVDYFNSKSSTPQVIVNINGNQQLVYSEKELLHLKDVREIIRIFSILQITAILIFVSVAILLYSTFGFRRLLQGIQIGAIIAGTVTAVLVVWALLDFNGLFLLFHFVSFSNDLWILDPANDYLIMMFPEIFFNHAAILIVLTILIESIVIGIAAYLIYKVLTGNIAMDKIVSL